MPTLAEHRLLRLVTLTALYLAQGIPWGFVTVGYVVLLADLGFSNTEVGAAIGLAYLPWSFKVAWGPLLDAVPPLRIGRRRPFIVGSELMMGVTLLALGWLDPRESIVWVTALLFLNNTFASLQDVAVDGLAVEILDEHERGRANSFMWAGKSLGVVAGGGGGTLFAKHFGWEALFVTMALAIWAVMLLPLFLRERPPREGDQPVDARLWRLLWFLLPIAAVGVVMYLLSEVESEYAGASWVKLIPVFQPFAAVLGAIAAWRLVDRKGFAELSRSFSFSTPWWGVAVGVLTPVGYALVQGIFTRILRADLHLSDEEIATLTGVVEPISGVIGALIGGVLADKLGARRALALTMTSIALCLATWAVSESLWFSWTFVLVWDAAFNASIYAYNTSSFGMFMAISNPRIGATHFAIFMATTNLTYSWASPLGGILADNWGYVAFFAVAAVIQVAMIVVLWPLDIDRAARVYASQAPR